MRTAFYFAESFDEPGGEGAHGMCHLFLYFFSLVLFVSKFLVHLSALYALPQKLAQPLVVASGCGRFSVQLKSFAGNAVSQWTKKAHTNPATLL